MGFIRLMFSVFLFLEAVVGQPDSALADEPLTAAKQAFDNGSTSFFRGEYAAAADHFREAYQLKPSWKILYNIGQCEAAVGRYGLAMEMFEKYLSLGGDEIPVGRRNKVSDEIEELRKTVGYIQLRGVPDGARVVVDGVERGRAPLPGLLYISSGIEHTVGIYVDGKEIYRQALSAPGTVVRTVDVNVASEEMQQTQSKEQQPALDVVTSTESGPGRRFIISGAVIGGVGIAELLVAMVMGTKGKGIYDDISDECAGGCPREYATEQKELMNLLHATDVLLISGIILTAAGTTLFAVGKRKNRKRERLTLLPSFTDKQFALGIYGSF
ncbi:MAG: tetratricopeptide repeat protein [Deltaproteobacteria bacterium]|nr:tetratricopeptide repeat protein [Deltaproteobacteria bacterium]